MKRLLILILLLLPSCMYSDQELAVRAADDMIEPIELVFDLNVDKVEFVNDTYFVYYMYEDGSGPLIVEVHDNKATHFIVDGEREEAQEYVDDFRRGVEIMTGFVQ